MPVIIRGSSGGNAITDSTYTPGMVVQVQSYQTGALASGSTTTPIDDTIPQNTEGVEFMTVSITPRFSTSKLFITSVATFSGPTNGTYNYALFRDSIADALATNVTNEATATGMMSIALQYYMNSPGTSATTFKIRLGCNQAGTVYLKGYTGGRLSGGVVNSSITVMEIAQ